MNNLTSLGHYAALADLGMIKTSAGVLGNAASRLMAPAAKAGGGALESAASRLALPATSGTLPMTAKSVLGVASTAPGLQQAERTVAGTPQALARTVPAGAQSLTVPQAFPGLPPSLESSIRSVLSKR